MTTSSNTWTAITRLGLIHDPDIADDRAAVVDYSDAATKLGISSEIYGDPDDLFEDSADLGLLLAIGHPPRLAEIAAEAPARGWHFVSEGPYAWGEDDLTRAHTASLKHNRLVRVGLPASLAFTMALEPDSLSKPCIVQSERVPPASSDPGELRQQLLDPTGIDHLGAALAYVAHGRKNAGTRVRIVVRRFDHHEVSATIFFDGGGRVSLKLTRPGSGARKDKLTVQSGTTRAHFTRVTASDVLAAVVTRGRTTTTTAIDVSLRAGRARMLDSFLRTVDQGPQGPDGRMEIWLRDVWLQRLVERIREMLASGPEVCDIVL